MILNLNKQINTTRLMIFVVMLLVISIIAYLFINAYLSKVIISQPFCVTIDGISAEDGKVIKVIGYSPYGNVQQLNKVSGSNTWEYNLYSSFKSLIIYLPDNTQDVGHISVTVKGRTFVPPKITDSFLHNQIDLTAFLRKETSKTEIALSIFHWREFRFLLTLFLTAIACFIFLILFIKKNKKIPIGIKIAWALFIVGLLTHILFFVLTKKYLITSGVILIILISIIFYWTLKLVTHVFKRDFPWKEVKLSVLSVSICLCLIEVILILTGFMSTYAENRDVFYYSSAFNPEKKDHFMVWGIDRDLKTSEYCFHRKINSEGLSDKEHSVIKKENEYRILALGDSFTEGDGADTDSTWLKFLERDLSKFKYKKELSYMNAGVCGSDLYFEYVLLKERLLKYSPDLVLLAVNNSDISDILLRGGMERFRTNGTLQYNSAPWWESLYASSHISRLFFSAFGYNDMFRKESENYMDDANEKIIAIIDKFNELSIDKSFQLMLIFHPFRDEVEDGSMRLNMVESKFSSDTTVVVLNMLKYFNEIEKMNSSNSQNYYWVKDGHHNAKGYAAFARGVEWKLKQTGILDSLLQK